MRVAYRIRSDDGFTDICECAEFKGTTSGLGIAWICGNITEFQAESCTVTIPTSNSKNVISLKGSLHGPTPEKFIRIWHDKQPTQVVLVGKHEEKPVTVTAVMGKRVLQILYPRSLEGKIVTLEKMISNAIEKHFALLTHKTRVDMGSKYLDTYECPVFTDQNRGLLISATSGMNSESLIRWYSHYQCDIKRTDPLYGVYTERKRYTLSEYVSEVKDLSLDSSHMVMLWRGKPLSVICDYKEKVVRCFWDKWLSLEIDEYIKWLNTELYETVFGQLLGY